MSASTKVFNIAPNPHWVIIDNFSKLPVGAAIYTYRNLNPNEFKPAFRDAAGQIPYGQPIVGFGNGTMDAIFWEFDPDNPTETYYIRVYDKEDVPGGDAAFLWDFRGLSGAGGGGGGGSNTTLEIDNLVINNIFWRNIGNITGAPSVPMVVTLAPGAHQGFVNDPANTQVQLNGPVGPDIIFAKSNTSATDKIEFVDFSPTGQAFLPFDVTPQQYFQYSCTVTGSSETYKYVQFPIAQGVQNLNGQDTTVVFYGRNISGNSQVKLYWRQFFGSGAGAPDPDVFLEIATIDLDTDWKRYSFSSPIPSILGKNIGSVGNDGLFFQVRFALSGFTGSNAFIKPEIFLGTLDATGAVYENHDKIDSLINTPRTGDIRTSVNLFAPYGWVIMNDGTIANGSSGINPPASGFARNNIDTFPLFDLLWHLPNGVVPGYNSLGFPIGGSGRGSDAVADFVAGNQLKLTLAAGRVFAAVSGGHLIGEVVGSETHTLTILEMPAHSHPPISGTGFDVKVPVGGIDNFNPGTQNATQATTGNTGGGLPHSIMQPTTYMNVFIKL